MLSCKEAAKLQSLAMEGKLSTRQRIALRFHSFICACPVCKGFGRQLNALRAAASCYARALELGECQKDQHLDDAAKERIKSRLQSES